MAKAHPIWTNFTGGEFSPLLEGRIDLAKYFNAGRILKNMLVHPHGPASNRSGFRFIGKTNYHNKKSRLIPFEFSTEQAYILEFGDRYIHFWMNHGQVTSVDAYTKLLLHCDGLDASTVFEDSGFTEHVVTAHGNAQIDTAQKKFGSASGLFDGDSDYLTIPDHADWFMDTGAFTIDFWVRFASVTDQHQGLFYVGDDTANCLRAQWDDSSGKLNFSLRAASANVWNIETTWSPLANTWYHLAFIRGWAGVNTEVALVVDGTAISSTTVGAADSVADYEGLFHIGYYIGANTLNGWIDEFRVSKGIARWTENFVPPTVEYPQAQDSDPYEIASPYLESDLPHLKHTQSADIMWLTHPNHKPQKLSRTGHTNWTLSEVDFIDGPYEPSSGEEQATLGTDLAVNGLFTTDEYWIKGTGWSITGGKAVGVAGVESDIYQGISITQDEDYEVVVTLSDRTDGTITPKVGGTEGLSRNKNGIHTERITCGGGAANIAFEKSADFDGKIDDVSVKKVTYNNENNLKPSGVTGNVTIEADLNIFAETDEGRLLRWQADDANWYWFEITVYADPKHVSATVKGNDLPNTNKSSPFRLGTWCEELGYPSCIAFYEERLGFAGSKGYPQTVWLSASGDYDNFTPGTTDADPITYALAADQVNSIRWMSPGKRLLIGTVGGEWNLGSSSLDEPLTPTNIRVVRETAHGSKDIQAVRAGHVVLFVQKAGKKVREITYSLEVDSYVAPDMRLLANHITKPQINDMVYQQEPFSIVWCVRSDGVLLGLTYLREHEVVAWHRHITEGEFESVAVIPGTQKDELWAIVKRTIGSQTKRYVELLESPFDDTDTKNAFFVDSGLSYDGEPTKTIGGLDHLEGEEVTVLADGATHPNKTVSGNSITLDREASKVHVGLGYRSVLQTMRLEAGAIDGTAQGRIKRISKVIARLYKTLGCKIGPDEDTLDTIFFRDSSMPMDAPPDLFTGDKELDYPEGYETDAHITIVQDLPLPLTVVALMPQIRTTDD